MAEKILQLKNVVAFLVELRGSGHSPVVWVYLKAVLLPELSQSLFPFAAGVILNSPGEHNSRVVRLYFILKIFDCLFCSLWAKNGSLLRFLRICHEMISFVFILSIQHAFEWNVDNVLEAPRNIIQKSNQCGQLHVFFECSHRLRQSGLIQALVLSDASGTSSRIPIERNIQS